MMITCRDCDTAQNIGDNILQIHCAGCNTLLRKVNGQWDIARGIEAQKVITPTRMVRKINLDTLETTGYEGVNQTKDSNSHICLICNNPQSDLTSISASLNTGWGKKLIPTDQLDSSGNPVYKEVHFPLFQKGRICNRCFSLLEVREVSVKDNSVKVRAGYFDTSGNQAREVIIHFEDVKGRTIQNGGNDPKGEIKHNRVPERGVDYELRLLPGFGIVTVPILNKDKAVNVGSYRAFLMRGKINRFGREVEG